MSPTSYQAAPPREFTIANATRRVKSGVVAVASSVLCKFLEGLFLPRAIQMVDHAEDDAFTAGRVGEAGHRPGTAAHFAKSPFNHVGGAYFLPMCFGHGEEVQ